MCKSKKKYKTRYFAALQHRDQLINNSRVHFGVNSIKDFSDCSQKPFEPGFDVLKRSRPALKALIFAEHRTPNGSWFQYLIIITLLLKKSCADLKE